MTRRNSSVNKTLEDPDSNIIRKNPAALPSSLFFGISGRNTIARDHLTAIPRLCRMAVFHCGIGTEDSAIHCLDFEFGIMSPKFCEAWSPVALQEPGEGRNLPFD
jgi:hypothetical protein